MSIEVATDTGGNIRYTDRKRWLWPLSLLWPLMPVICGLLAIEFQQPAYHWLTLAIWYLVLPALDHLLPADPNNPPPEVIAQLDQDRYYRVLTYLTVPIHFITLIFGAWIVATQNLPWHALLGLGLSVGVVNGLAINTGHELGHKNTTLERWLARIVLAVCGYGHFYVEHNRGHHKDVATPEDPATSRMGENIYEFALFREIPGAIHRAWTTETQRLARAGRSPWTLDNEFLQPLLMTLSLYGLLIAVLGWVVLPFLLIQMAFAWWQLTSANYIEHYGLLRQRRADGRYEAPRPEHSWNSNHVMSNLVLFHLQRHSDHHANPTRRYQCLRNYERLPNLPSGYPAMFAIAMLPPLWFALMDPRVLAWSGRELSQVNIKPGLRERYAVKLAHG